MQINFEDIGQDLLRLVVDDETGLIRDCGPYHADLYAQGDCWVELESVQGGAGSEVFYYRGAEDRVNKMGKAFRWPVASIVRNKT